MRYTIMDSKGKADYLSSIRERYFNSRKSQKNLILNEFCSVCNYSRKYAIYLLKKKTNLKLIKKSGPKKIYDDEVINQLKILYFAFGEMCSKNMVAALPLWLPLYADKSCTLEVRTKLLSMSSSTIDRYLKDVKETKFRGISGTRPSLLKNRIPIKLLDGDNHVPGYMEGDTVAHCGNSLGGSFIWSLTLTDPVNGWTENRAVWTKEASHVMCAVKDIEEKLPYNLLGFASDNGTEFINETLQDYFKNRDNFIIDFVRRRPYKKNDNAHVEQKNWTHVRQLFGYSRFDDKVLLELMNEIYIEYWNPIQNFYTPSMKLVEKIRIGGKIKKRYDAPKTPYQRLMEDEQIGTFQKEKLHEKYCKLNPFTLKQKLDEKIKIFHQLVIHSRLEAA